MYIGTSVIDFLRISVLVIFKILHSNRNLGLKKMRSRFTCLYLSTCPVDMDRKGPQWVQIVFLPLLFAGSNIK